MPFIADPLRVGTVSASSNGRYEGRWPGGDRPGNPIVLAAVAAALAAGAVGLTTGSSAEVPYETTADKYVSSSGNNANTGTSGSPYATIAYALSQISAGQTVGVLSDLAETLAWNTVSPGSSWASPKSVVGIGTVRVITGAMSGSGSKFIRFKGLHWTDANEKDCFDATNLKFIACGFFGGPTSGNTVTHLAGSHQLYEGCWFGGLGGRYASLCYERTNVLYRRCVVRTDNWGSPADDGNPNGGIQIYSSNNCARINCIAVDCAPQRSNNENLAGFPVTTNTGTSTGIVDIGCISADSDYFYGFQVEGSNACTYSSTDCVAVRVPWGFIENLDSGGGSITMNGGEYSSNDNYGIASFGSEGFSPTNVNTTGNTNGNFNGVSAGSGCTTNALNMNTRLSAMKRIGVSESMYGDAGWNTTQAEDLFPFPYETDIRAKFAALSTRGFCGGSYSLTGYLKR